LTVKTRPEYPPITGKKRPSGHPTIRSSGHQVIRSSTQYRLALLSGALLIFCFPGPDLGWLGWVALAPLFAALLAPPAGGSAAVRRGAGLGFVAGVVFLAGLLSWIWIFGWYAWLALIVCEGLWFALFGALAALLLRRAPRALAPPTLAATWTVVEWLRGLGILGLTWGDLAVSQHRTLPVLQMLDWTGPWGLSFLIALTNASLAQMLVAPRLPTEEQLPYRRAGGRWLAAAAVVVGLLTVRGAWLLAVPAGATANGKGAAPLPVAVIQGNVDQDVVWDSDYWRRAMRAHARLTMEAARAGARLVIWSETSLPGELRSDPTLRRIIARLARTANTELIIGSNDRLGEAEYNRAFLVDREGRLRGGYAKRHLVPYGECVPLHAWLPFMDALHVRPFNLTPGEGYFPLRGEHRIGAVVCFESAFPEISRAMTKNGAEILVEISNDTWFGRSAAAAQHAAMAPLRAVETRRAFARSTATGISTLVDDYGRVRRQLGLFQAGYLLDRMPLRRDLTPYVRFGDWPVGLSLFFCLALLGHCGVAAIRRPRRTDATG
jgi:apolipoprotein N-acyltransferase